MNIIKEEVRTYTNPKGEIIEVTKEHLDTAVELKLQLQELSPSRKCNWTHHKDLMEKSGFFDSCKSENYRCLIKSYQRKIGKLQKREDYNHVITDNKILAIQKEVGELYYQKKAVQEKIRKLNRLKNDVTKVSLISEEIRDLFIDYFNLEIPHYLYQKRLPSTKNKAILIVTDWHIGATISNVSGNSYNFKIAKKRIEKLKKEVLDYCTLWNITDLEVVCLGDLCEHVSMRNVTQAYDIEMNFSHQIIKATELMIDLLTSLSTYLNVNYTGISGNHDRMNPIAKDNLDGDNAMVLINHAINSFIEFSKIPRLSFCESDEILYSCVKELNGKKIKFVHGDNETRNDKNKLDKQSSMDNIVYDALIMGHYHHYSVFERNHGRLEIYIGSIMGRNNYSKKIKATTDASQGLIIVREDGEILPLKIGLQIH
jgi:predicted phosphodiesterase